MSGAVTDLPRSPAHKRTAVFCLSQGATQTYALGSACGVSTHRGQLAAGPARGRLRFHASVAEPLPVPWEVTSRDDHVGLSWMEGSRPFLWPSTGGGWPKSWCLPCLPSPPQTPPDSFLRLWVGAAWGWAVSPQWAALWATGDQPGPQGESGLHSPASVLRPKAQTRCCGTGADTRHSHWPPPAPAPLDML